LPRTQLVLPAGRRPVDRLSRTARAAWRDSKALWREFRVPFLALNIAIFGGSLLYGYLYNNVAGITPPLPVISLPYTMLGLMTLQAAGDPPMQPYLMAFWYIMPAIGVYVVGRGAAEFVRLFFDRTERRAEWEEAVASTYRNHVIILGVGHVGLRVVRTLVAMGFEVVGIDQRVKPEIDDELGRLGVPVIIADGRSPATLEAAGLRDAQSFVVCTANDQTNIEVIMRARDFNPDIRIVVRMWDSQFATQLHRFMGVEAVLSASDLAAPAFAGAAVGIEVTQSLTVHDVDYSMIRLQVEPGSFMDGETIETLENANDVDIVLHGRDGDVDVHPPHDIRVQSGDTLVIFARHSQITGIVANNRRQSTRNRTSG
jgi:voltage-gated potassium channel